MSIQSWKEEYYPVEVRHLLDEGTPEEAEIIEHSLRKWHGLRRDALEKHGVAQDPSGGLFLIAADWLAVRELVLARRLLSEAQRRVQETRETPFPITDSTCSLCQMYYDEESEMAYSDDLEERCSSCRNCPIVEMSGETCATAYAQWVKHGNPEPMIDLLERTLSWAREE